jgi:hypothetical protein
MLNSYPIFAEYNYYLKKWLEVIMTLPRIDALNLKIPVVYSSPRRAFALGSSSGSQGATSGTTTYAPPNEGNNWLPVMTFRLNAITPVIAKTGPYEHVLVRPIQDNNNNVTGYIKSKPLQVYEIGYIGSLYCGLMQDADILVYKFLTEFRPNAYLWIGPCAETGNDEKGVWAHMVLEGIADTTEYEPLDISERVVKKDFSWKITDAFVPTTEGILSEDIVKEVYTDLYGDYTVGFDVEAG